MTQKPIKVHNLPAVRRLPVYWYLLQGWLDRGWETVSTTVIADELKLDAIQVRKDLAITGITGKPRVGYPIATLVGAIEAFLGWDNDSEACLVGVGHLGTALLGYNGFASYRLKIVAAFDEGPERCRRTVHGLSVLPIAQMPEVVRRRNIRIAILTVPAEAAQAVAEELVAAGIRGIWNFTPTVLTVPAEVVVQNEDLGSGLAVLSHKLTQVQLQQAEPAAQGEGDG